jgi:phytoene desaturase (3,4-didehydrolycopene-forming)
VSFDALAASSLETNGNSPKQVQEVVIVGGGVGGLSVAARISAMLPSCHVTILEKNSHVGGRCGSFDVHIPNVGKFRHERGPSLLLLPDVYKNVFRECRESDGTEYGLSMTQCIPAYQVVFEDGDAIEVGFPRASSEVMSATEITSRQIMDSFETEGSLKWDIYMKAASAFLDCGLPNFIEERLDILSFPAFLREALRDYGKAWPLKPHSDVLDEIFESEKMFALAAFQDLYVGLEPYRNNQLFGGGVLKSTAPAVFGLLAAIELHPNNKKAGGKCTFWGVEGSILSFSPVCLLFLAHSLLPVFAPVGGFAAVSSALEELALELGVTIQCNKTVTSVHSDGVFVCDTGPGNDEATAKNEFVRADLIVVNADLPYATKSLLFKDTSSDNTRRQPQFDWDDSFSFSAGVISFHWSVGKSLDDLNTHNVFLVAASRSQAEASWQVLRTNRGNVDAKQPFNFYVHRATKTDPTAAPAECDSIMVLVPCRTLLRDADCAKLPRNEAMKKYSEQFSEDVVSKARQAVLERLSALGSLCDLKDHILDEVVDTPATWADQYNLAAGTPFALVRSVL